LHFLFFQIKHRFSFLFIHPSIPRRKRSRDLGCDLFFEISVREEVDVAKRVMEDLYFRWKYNQSHHHQSHSPQTQQPRIHHSAPRHQTGRQPTTLGGDVWRRSPAGVLLTRATGWASLAKEKMERCPSLCL
jgi:hypothetical protein